MKVNIKKLVYGKYYICNIKDSDIKIIFQYNDYDKIGIYYKISFQINSKGFYMGFNENSFLPIDWYKTYCISSREVLFEDIAYCFPDDHIDKKNYYRKQKIKYLLSK